MLKPLDLRDAEIITALPPMSPSGNILIVGCGEGRIDQHLTILGYNVISTDIAQRDLPNFHILDIFDISKFPFNDSEVTICSQVIEHLPNWELAFLNLIKLTTKRLIITVPYSRSFFDPGHVSFWEDNKRDGYNDVNEFIELAKPYSTSISKIRTKPADTGTKCLYLIVVDKLQDAM